MSRKPKDLNRKAFELARELASRARIPEKRLRRLRAYTLEIASSFMAQVYSGLLSPQELAAIQSALLVLTLETFQPSKLSEHILFFGSDIKKALEDMNLDR